MDNRAAERIMMEDVVFILALNGIALIVALIATLIRDLF
jgi:hypothetical protein